MKALRRTSAVFKTPMRLLVLQVPTSAYLVLVDLLLLLGDRQYAHE